MKTNYRVIIILFLLIIISFFTDFRSFDTEVYRSLYDGISSVFDINFRFLKIKEPLFVIIVSLLKTFLSFEQTISILAILPVLITYAAIKRISSNIEISLCMYGLMYFYFLPLGQTRQAISLSICLYALSYLLEGKPKKEFNFFFLIVISTLIHYSAFIFSFSYFLIQIPFKKINMVRVLLIGLVVFLVIRTFKHYVTLSLGTNIIYNKFYYYGYVFESKSSSLIAATIEKITITFGLFYFLRKCKDIIHREVLEKLITLFFIGLVFNLVFLCDFAVISSRGAIYFFMLIIFIIPIMLESIKEKKTVSLLINLMYVFLVIRFLFKIYLMFFYG